METLGDKFLAAWLSGNGDTLLNNVDLASIVLSLGFDEGSSVFLIYYFQMWREDRFDL